jgi:hypothetical protein
MLFPQIDGYVCLTCGEAIENPSAETGHLRCPHGHFVDGVKSGPLWATAINAHFATLIPLAALAALLRSHWVSWVMLAGIVAWSVYMFVLGVLLPRERAEIKTIAAQFMVSGIARIGAAIAVGLYVWFVLRHGNWLL